jgi:preprotein translocase subunit SecE
VARDRKRAKQRRVRRGRAGAAHGTAAGAPPAPPVLDDRDGTPALPESQPARADVPGALDHASGDVDEFDAALIRGSGGVTATPETGLEETELPEVPPSGSDDELQDGDISGGGTGGAGDGAGGAGGPGGGGDHERPSGAPLRGGNRALAFLRASWAELQRVQWPDRRQVTQATAVVLGFVAVAGAYLGLADYVAKELVELFL